MDLGRKRFAKAVNGRDLILEVSHLASQTNASAIATYGQTTVLATVVMDKEDQPSDYFPLRVDYEEKFYAAGKILGSRYTRREGRPSDDATLSGRVIDRVIRPLFDQRIRRGVQVVATVLSYDGENDPDFVALMAVSTALAISDIPWAGPVAGLRVAKGDKFLISPTNSEVGSIDKGKFDAFIAGTSERINMIELGGYEISEEDASKACELALGEIKELVDFQKEIVSQVGKTKVVIEIPEAPDALVSEVKNFLGDKLEAAIYITDKKEAEGSQYELKENLMAHLQSKEFTQEDLAHVPNILETETDALIKKNILENDKRPDGRGLDEIRELYGEVAVFPRMHGSAIFARGDTQALAITTLGAPGDEQLVENVEFSGGRRFMLHYNFPPYSVGEAKSFRGPGRRDIGHGALAQKAIEPLMPSKDEFPYTTRIVSEILSSNGSSSMATVSASSMSLMDAGVPIKAAVAGIAMGLVLDNESGKYKILTDIQGPEDHYGGMDFKVAGTKDGINAVQLDVKIDGLTLTMIREILAKATQARLHVLETTNAVIDKPRAELSEYAPRILTTKISPDRIGELIGPGGKVINGLIEETGVDSIDIDDDGTVMVTTTDAKKGETAITRINAMMKEYTIGEMVEGNIIKLLDFGAIVDLGGGKDGMVHISEFKDAFVKDIKEVAKEGDHVKAKVISVENGRIGLSVKRVKE